MGASLPRSKTCKHCTSTFMTCWPRQAFCSKQCRQDFFNAKNNALRAPKHAPRPCDICTIEYTPTRSDSLTCSNRCRARLNYRRSREWRTEWARARRAARRGLLTEDFSLLDIAERDRWRCQICGHSVDKTLKWPHTQCGTMDHIVPIALGGEHSRANCQLAHANCNRSKGARLSEPVQLALLS
jgi:5-methylcytosine-specific restriction endonuclease McrA